MYFYLNEAFMILMFVKHVSIVSDKYEGEYDIPFKITYAIEIRYRILLKEFFLFSSSFLFHLLAARLMTKELLFMFSCNF